MGRLPAAEAGVEGLPLTSNEIVARYPGPGYPAQFR